MNTYLFMKMSTNINNYKVYQCCIILQNTRYFISACTNQGATPMMAFESSSPLIEKYNIPTMNRI